MLETPTADFELRKTYMEARRARAAAFARVFSGLRNVLRASLSKSKEVAKKGDPRMIRV